MASMPVNIREALSFVRWIAQRPCYCESGRGPFEKREGDDPNADLKCDPCRARAVASALQIPAPHPEREG